MKPTVGAALIAFVRRSSGLSGGAPPARPPRPARPARPAGAAGAGLGGAGGGALNAASSGARSTSVDQRNNSIVNGAVGAPAPITLAFTFSAGAAPSANVRPALTMTSIAAAVISPATTVRLLPVTVVRAFGSAEPLHQAFQLLVLELGAALAHVNGHHAPSFGRIAGSIHPVNGMT